VHPEEVRELQAILGQPLAVSQLVAMRIHGVKPDYARGMKETGLLDLNVERFVALRIHGVSVEDAVRARERYGDQVTADQLIEAKISGRHW
jgi:hypothetical protein